MSNHHIERTPNQSGPPSGDVISAPDAAPISGDEGMSAGDAALEHRLNEYHPLFQLFEQFGFNKKENDDLPTGYSWYYNAGWPRSVVYRQGILPEASFSPCRIEQVMDKSSRMLKEVRIPLRKANPILPNRPMAQEKPIAFYDLILNFEANRPCDWDSIVAELKPLAESERAMAEGEQGSRNRDHEKMLAQLEARNDPTAVVRAAVSELVKQLKPQDVK